MSEIKCRNDAEFKLIDTATKTNYTYEYDTVTSQVNGLIQLCEAPAQTLESSAEHFLSAPSENNPAAAVVQYYKDVASASYVHDWDTVEQKLGSGLINLAGFAAAAGKTESAVKAKYPNGNDVDFHSLLCYKNNRKGREKVADKDTVTKEYMQDNEVFADAFNFYMFDGEQVIKPEELHPLDTTAIALPFGDDSPSKPVQKYRCTQVYCSNGR